MMPVAWVTLKQTQHRWEADLIAGILTAHHIPVQVLNCSGLPCLSGGAGSATIRVPASERWSAWLLISPVEDGVADSLES